MSEFYTILERLTAAILMGGVIGLERAFHGRPAGLRTHALVCTASSLLMLLTVFQWELLSSEYLSTLRVDPTRMAQGIMTGIGFLGAGVIMKENLTIRGLTTAASVWTTAAIGIMAGMGFYIPAVLATVMTFLILSVFGWVERRMQSRRFARLMVRFKRHVGLPQAQLYEVINTYKISAYGPSYHLEEKGSIFEYTMTINTRDPENFHRLADALTNIEQIVEFSIQPTGD